MFPPHLPFERWPGLQDICLFVYYFNIYCSTQDYFTCRSTYLSYYYCSSIIDYAGRLRLFFVHVGRLMAIIPHTGLPHGCLGISWPESLSNMLHYVLHYALCCLVWLWSLFIIILFALYRPVFTIIKYYPILLVCSTVVYVYPLQGCRDRWLSILPYH